MGKINGKPAVIQTVTGRPTAIGITTDFRYWYGEHFSEARRVLDDTSTLPGKTWEASAPVIPSVYQLSPQKSVTMPDDRFMRNNNADVPSNSVDPSITVDTSEPAGPSAEEDLSEQDYSVSSTPQNPNIDNNEVINADIPIFSDISGHWAEEYIRQLQLNKSASGYPDGTFQADNFISRAEFVTMLVKSLQLSPKTGKVFVDTANHWAQNYIATAEDHGIVSGYDTTSFGPDNPITREQMAVMIIKAT